MKFLKNRKNRNRLVRAAIQLIFFIMAPGVFSVAFSGDCFQCGAGADTCPKGNIGLGEKRRFKGSEIMLTIIKAGVLFAICCPWM